MKKAIVSKELDSGSRINSFDEVVLGYSEEEALREAARCLQCENPTCISGCPVNIDIKRFVFHIAKREYDRAYFTIIEKNNFPSICGRVCPAEYQCRRACVLTKKGSPFATPESINIHLLERFAGDYGIRNSPDTSARKDARLKDKKAAIVGSGPAGLACAGELARHGIRVTVFEGLHKTAGVLRYGIPPFRLPRDILEYEIERLAKLGVEFINNCIIGKTMSLSDLTNHGYDAVFLGLGAGTPQFLDIEGEGLCGVYSANEFLTRINLMSAYKFPDYHTPVNIGNHAVVIGGGNTAMDAARSAIRLQTMSGVKPDTTVLYRRTDMEMPSRRVEIEHAREEGIKFRMLVKPDRFIGNEKASVTKLRCLECKLGEPDSSGRRRSIPLQGTGFEIPCDVAIEAVGLNANRILTNVTPEIKIDAYGDIVVNAETMETSIKGVFAGGDIVGGEGTVIEAMGMAKKAARAIIDYLL